MFNDSKIKYLEMIQSVITRMASNSFVLKGWLITLITAVCIISFSSRSKYLFILVFVPIKILLRIRVNILIMPMTKVKMMHLDMN